MSEGATEPGAAALRAVDGVRIFDSVASRGERRGAEGFARILSTRTDWEQRLSEQVKIVGEIERRAFVNASERRRSRSGRSGWQLAEFVLYLQC